MTTPNDIMTAINLELVKVCPIDPVYINLLPKDFARPSFLLECVQVMRQDENYSTVSVVAYFTITCFCEVDGHYNSDAEQLLERQTKVIDIFRRGYLTVGDRAIKAQASSGGMDFTQSYVDVQFEYFDARDDAPDTTPLMEAVKTNITT